MEDMESLQRTTTLITEENNYLTLNVFTLYRTSPPILKVLSLIGSLFFGLEGYSFMSHFIFFSQFALVRLK